jgi:UDPglucose--hexose-1-phosphate uridylyltransferase
MPELRRDPVVDRWVIIAMERARRPSNFVNTHPNFFDKNVQEQACPFCNNQDQTIFSLKDEKSEHHDSPWDVKVVESGTPVVRLSEKFKRRGYGLYDVVNGYGAHEVVIETPRHIANMADLSINQIRLVIKTYTARFHTLEKVTNSQYVLAFKNYGWAAGSRLIGHSRSQIIATPVNPLRIKEKLIGAKRHFEYHDRCLYCDLIRQELKTKERIVTETAFFIALTPFAPRFPFEVWIFPKKHHCDFAKGIIGQEEDLAILLKDILSRFKVGLGDPAYNYIIQSAPFHSGKRSDKWKTLEQDYHWHIELMPRLTQAAGFEKGTGFYICPIPPEATAEYLREVQVP